MRPSFFSLLAAVTSGLVGLTMAQLPDKVILYNEEELVPIWEAGRSSPPATVTRINRWVESVPYDCAWLTDRFISGMHICPLANLDVFQAWFSDAPDPWIVCRCRDAPVSETETLAMIGRLPAAVRQYVRYFLQVDVRYVQFRGALYRHGDMILTRNDTWVLNVSCLQSSLAVVLFLCGSIGLTHHDLISTKGVTPSIYSPIPRYHTKPTPLSSAASRLIPSFARPS